MGDMGFTDEKDRLSNSSITEPDQPTALVILGMHRSGTSALARVLSLSGFCLPRDLMAPAEDNPEGFWESDRISRFNDKLLRIKGSHWDDPFSFSPEPRGHSLLRPHLTEAVDLLRTDFPDDLPIVFKDPRLSLLIPFWHEALRRAGYTPRYLIGLRHPLEIAQSLAKRNKFPLEKSYLIWLSYMLSIERDTRDLPRSFISYDHLLSDWSAALDTIEARLNVRFGRRDPSAQIEIEGSLKAGLRNHQSALQGRNRKTIPIWVKYVYEMLSDESFTKLDETNARLKSILENYAHQRRFFGPILRSAEDALQTHKKASEEALHFMETKLDDSSRAYEAEIASRGRELEQERAVIQRLSSENDSQASLLANLQTTLSDRNEALRLKSDALTQNVEQTQRLEEQLRQFRETVNTLDAEAKHAQIVIDGLETDVNAAQAIIAERETEAKQAKSVIDNLDDEVQNIRSVLEQRDADAAHAQMVIDDLQAELIDTQAIIDALEADAKDAQAVIDTLETDAKQVQSVLEEREADAQRAQAVIDALEADAKQAQSVLEEREADAQRAQAVIDALEADAKHAQSVLEEREADAQRAQAVIDALEADAKHAQSVLEEREADARRAQAEIGDLEEDAQKAQALITHLESDAQHAQNVINALEAELKREQTVSLDRFRSNSQLSRDLNELRASTIWRATGLIRRIGAKVPIASKIVRRVTGRASAVPKATLLPSAPRVLTEQTHINAPSPLSRKASLTRGDIRTPMRPEGIEAARPQFSDWDSFDPDPIAEFLQRRDENDIGADAFRHHCANFPLPYAADQMEKPKLTLNDAQAKLWIDRLRSTAESTPDGGPNPDVTIVVPVYNQLAFTISALASVYEQNARRRFEIILADDASTDQTRWLEEANIKNLRIARTAGNVGFLENANQAAKYARGAFIVLLNNDTVALNGWLDALIDTLEADPTIGLVGSQLIFPNGRLQEAGGIVWRDGSAWNYGRNEDPQDPRYAFARDVDYCSGASIALRTELWKQLEGFDGNTYKKAYYEDTDLAFRVREAGYRVRYQPRSALLHFEGASSGMDLNSGQKQYQAENEKRFLKRWQKTLSHHNVNGENPIAEANRNLKKNILIIDAVTPTPDKDAGSLVTVEMILALQADGYQVSFIPEDNFAYLSDCSPQLLAAGVQIFHWPFYKSVDEVLEFNGDQFEAILIFRVTCADKHLPTIQDRAPHAKVLFHVADLHHLREAREAEVKHDKQLMLQAQKTEQREIAAVQASDLTIVHSAAERDVLNEKAPGSEVYVFPWIAEPATDIDQRPAHRSGIVFVGGFRHRPNVQGLLWFVEQVWPTVHQQDPSLSFTVIGAEAPPEIQALDGQNGIKIVGWVPELDPYFETAKLSVAPLTYGAGVKGKVISSFSAGLPVVGTSIALEGLADSAQLAALIADDPSLFAQHILDLVKDDALWLEKSQAGIDFVINELSRKRGVERIAEMRQLVGLSH